MPGAASNSLSGKRIIVIGVSAGIGRALAVQAITSGADVALVGRRVERLQEIVSEHEAGHAIAADLADSAECARLVADAVAALGGPVDALVVCSGTGTLGLLRDTTREDWQLCFDVNVIGPSQVVAAALPDLAPGAFVGFLSSEAVGRPRHVLVPYSASKAALEEMVRGWRTEEPEVRFCTICVGATQGTEFARDFDFALAGELFPTWIAHAHMAQALMEAEDVGGAVLNVVVGALAYPGVDIQDVTLRPPGPLMTQDVSPLLDSLEENQTRAAT